MSKKICPEAPNKADRRLHSTMRSNTLSMAVRQAAIDFHRVNAAAAAAIAKKKEIEALMAGGMNWFEAVYALESRNPADRIDDLAMCMNATAIYSAAAGHFVGGNVYKHGEYDTPAGKTMDRQTRRRRGKIVGKALS